MSGVDFAYRKWQLGINYRYMDRINVEDFSLVDARLLGVIPI
ncbi:MAG: hypothetical protein R2784_04360 [Saprospiraceae bacterium]